MTAINSIIHQIWIGDASQAPQRLMDTWKMRGWRYMLWNEQTIKEFGTLKNQGLYDYFMRKKIYYGASDIVRLEVLEKFGGIYIDADAERLESLAGAPFLVPGVDFFAVEANKPGRVANGIIGAVPGHPILREYIAAMGKARKVEPVWCTIGGTMFTKMIEAYKTPGTMILEPHTFYPFDSKGVTSRTMGKSKTYGQHFWGSTHNLYGKNKF